MSPESAAVAEDETEAEVKAVEAAEHPEPVTHGHVTQDNVSWQDEDPEAGEAAPAPREDTIDADGTVSSHHPLQPAKAEVDDDEDEDEAYEAKAAGSGGLSAPVESYPRDPFA